MGISDLSTRILFKFLNLGALYRILLSAMMITTFLGISMVPAQAITTVSSSLCLIYNTVKGAIFLLGLVLILVGGALYAGAHIAPGNTKGTIQGYGMGFIMGGIIGVIIAVLAPFILQLITGYSVSQITGSNGLGGC